MKFIIIILCAFLTQVSAATFAQKVTYTEKNSSLQQVFNEIRKQTGYNVLWPADKLNINHKINADFNETPLVEVMRSALDGLPLTYVIDEKTIVIKEKPKPTLFERLIAQIVDIDVRGVVVDKKGLPLPHITIRVKGTRNAVHSNVEGKFLLTDVDEDATIIFSCIGFMQKEIKAAKNLGEVVMELQTNKLDEVSIKIKKQEGALVELKNRTHQTLSQVLEGGVPGLTLKRSETNREGFFIPQLGMDLEEAYKQAQSMPGEFAATLAKYPDYESYYRAFYEFRNSPSFVGRLVQTNTTTDNGIVPELRGSNSLGANTSGMLVVIDGFVQEGFPADYPMSNVASIEVIRDPAITTKWGPAAAGGVILITTNEGQPGAVRIDYNSNFYFSPQQDNSAAKLHLASSADFLDYYKEAYDKGIPAYTRTPAGTALPAALSPAEGILFNLKENQLTQDAFQSKWDSLATISNREQLRLLQQNSFNQNHSLTVSGGSTNYRFTAGGLYGTNRSTTLGSSSYRYGLNLKNDLALFKGKLRAKWLLNLTSFKNNFSFVNDGSNLDPYQLLLDTEGKYVYNYTGISPDFNNQLLSFGLYESGVNYLEDARSNKSINKSLQLNSNLNLDWNLSPGLLWTTSLRYGKTNTNDKNIKDANFSEVRQLINGYGSIFYNTNQPVPSIDVNFFLPPGSIFAESNSDRIDYNVRSGFLFDRKFGELHSINASIDGGMSSNEFGSVPNSRVYGYNPVTQTGLPIRDNPNPNLLNFQGLPINTDALLIPGFIQQTYLRNLTMNGSVGYDYAKRYGAKADYSAVLIPDVAGETPYATSSNRSLSGFWQIDNEDFFKLPWISSLKFTATGNEFKVAKLSSEQIGASQIVQTLYNNTAYRISTFNLAEQRGQINRSLSGQIDAQFYKRLINLRIGYTRNSTGQRDQWNARLAYNIAESPFFNVPFISSLYTDVTFQDINPFQALAISMNASSLADGGNFNIPANSSLGLLPAYTKNKEAHVFLGLNKDRYSIDLRYYHRVTGGLALGNYPTDPSTGLQSQILRSERVNKGWEIALRAAIFNGDDFSWNVTLNAAYNINQALNVPKVNYSATTGYLIAARNGYATDNLWSYNWAGLDEQGDPQIYTSNMEKTKVPDELALIYSGRTRAPYSGALIQEWRYRNFFVAPRIMFYFGHVMRNYVPALGPSPDNNIQIRDRWRKPGDEAFTDIARISFDDYSRRFIIQNSSNSILPADYVRLREIQVGYDVPASFLKGKFIKSLTVSMQMENVALWTKNDLNIDPETISPTGRVRLSRPKNYILSLRMSF